MKRAPETLTNRVPHIKYENSYRSDHSPVILEYKINEFINGKGFCKFNNSLLVDMSYINSIEKKIWESKKTICYALYTTEII